jgi:hypothetical protein
MCPLGDTTNGVSGPGPDEPVPQITQTAGLIQSQLKQLLQQRAAVVKRIAMIRRAIVGLNAIFADSQGEDSAVAVDALPLRSLTALSLTEACRSVLKNSPTPLTTTKTAALLRSEHGIDKKYLERSVAAICRRLVAYGELTVTLADSGRQAWAWRTDRGASPPTFQGNSDRTLHRGLPKRS